MMKNKKTAEEEARERFVAAKKKWAEEHSEAFLNTVKKVGDETGACLTPMQYVRAYQIGVEKLHFGYPTEHKISELISNDENYEQVLEIMTSVMKQFRLAFASEWKKNALRIKGRKRTELKKVI